VVILAHAQESAERHHGMGDLAVDLVDHDVIDAAKLLARAVVDRRPFHLVGGDEIECLAGIEVGGGRGDRLGCFHIMSFQIRP
jgi:hypothetical protein